MYKEEIINYYSRKDIQKAILELCENREVIPVLASGGFGKRPNAVFYERDIEQLVKEGAVSFHCSVERWKNPLNLRTDMRKSELDKLRVGWDLVIDLDCKTGLEDAKIAAQILIKALEDYGITGYSIKFSGNRGFHIGVPFEAFPQEIMALGTVDKQFPRLPKITIEYLKEFVSKDLKEAFGEEPDKVLVIDSGIITSRHLFRLPYCLHRKTWLASAPLDKKELEGFEKEHAKPSEIKIKDRFLNPNVGENEALELLQSAIFWDSRKNRNKPKEIDISKLQLPPQAIKPQFFPPCMHNILNGLEDGKKRSVFVLTTFLHRMGWGKEEIWSMLVNWNAKNPEPLRESTMRGTFNNQFSRQSPQMAPNCDHTGFYKNYGVCTPDKLCEIINNPVTYTLRRTGRGKPRRKSGKSRNLRSSKRSSKK